MQITINIPDDEYFLMMRLKALKGYGLGLKEGESQLDTARRGVNSGWFDVHMVTLTEFTVYLSPAGRHLITFQQDV